VPLSPELMRDWQEVARKAIDILAKQGAFTPEMLEAVYTNLQLYSASRQ